MINIGKNIFGSIVVAIGLFLFWPLVLGSWDRLALLQEAKAEREEILQRRIGTLSKVDTEYAQYAKLIASPEGKKFIALVPLKKNVPEILSAVSDVSASSGVEVREIAVSEGKATKAQGYGVLQLSLEVSGQYEGVRSFLDRLEAYVRILNVDSLEIASDPRNASVLNVIVRAQTYYIK